MEEKEKLNFLINTNTDFTKFLNIYVKIDNRKFFSEGSNSYASPLSEFDLIFLDIGDNNLYQSLSENRIIQLNKFLLSGKPFIFILRSFHSILETTNYKILEQIFGDIFNIETKDIGKFYSLTDNGKYSVFNEYLNGIDKNYTISFIVDKNEENLICLAKNTEDNCVAFSLRKFPNCFFIPWHYKMSDKLCEILIQLAIDSKVNGEPILDWVKEYSFSELELTDSRIEELSLKISELEDEKDKVNLNKIRLERIRDTLLFRDGKILEEVTKEVLIELGLEIKDGTAGKEDLKFVCNEKHYLLEVKGSNSSCQKNKHVGQIKNHISEYETEIEGKVKGILIMNAWRELPIEERDTNDTKIFPQESVKVAEISDIVLMTTQQLFVMYCDNLEGKFDLKEFMNKIDSTKGVLEGYDHIEEYKIKPVDEVKSIEEDNSKNQKA
ncbi:MAG TPA: hypothetical protein PL089_15090 [Ignavibacteria bacterium]|nr:hypothetical protein [Ignavibacteria bacterium]